MLLNPAHPLQTESRTAHRSVDTSQKGTGLLNLILIKTGANMFAVHNGHTIGTLQQETIINRKHMWHATGINRSQGIFQSKRTAAEWLAREQAVVDVSLDFGMLDGKPVTLRQLP